MGRLAVILGSNALGPGGEEIAAAAAAISCVLALCSSLAAATCRMAPTKVCVARASSSRRSVMSCAWPLESTAACSTLHAGPSIFADQRAHSAPGFDPRWRDEVLAAWSDGGDAPRDGGVYWQTRGPRFETPAEIRLIAPHADLVGMTIASECIVAGELGLEYAALCVVDNLANGLAEGELDVAALEDDRLANAERLREGLAAVLPRLGAVGR